VDLTSNDLLGIVGEPTHPDRAVRGELIGLTEKGIDLPTRIIPYLSIEPSNSARGFQYSRDQSPAGNGGLTFS
jgi:hypothetical protein